MRHGLLLLVLVACQPLSPETSVILPVLGDGPAPPSLETTPATTLSGPDGGWFGVFVAAAGDVNADGYADVIIGAYGVNSTAGAAYVYHGSSGGLASSPASSLYYPGTASTGMFGYGVGGAGDVNGDGYDDVIVGARGSQSSSTVGEAYVYAGSSSGVDTSYLARLVGTVGGGNFGQRVSGAGDVDGDGYDDVLVGAYGENDDGSFYLFSGSEEGPDNSRYTKVTRGTGSYFGYDLCGAGDMNEDGFADILVADYFGAYLAWGSEDGPSADALVELDASRGFASTSAGDVNGDGILDLAVGMYESGKVDLFLGAPDGPATSPSSTLTAGDQFGWAVSIAGDLDADGYADLLVGSLEEDDGDGRVQVFAGGAAGVEAESIVRIDGGTGAEFGRSAAIVGDVNGDGIDDALVGAMGQARAYLYLGGRDADGDGHPESSDCDDSNPEVFPGAVEICDSVDNDCDGTVDGSDATDATAWNADGDNDGFRSETDVVTDCEAPDGYGAGEAPWDCDDTDPDSYPGAEEVPGDGIDQDCDGEDEPGPGDSQPLIGDSGDESDSGTGTGGGKERGCAALPSPSTPGGGLAVVCAAMLAVVTCRRSHRFGGR